MGKRQRALPFPSIVVQKAVYLPVLALMMRKEGNEECSGTARLGWAETLEAVQSICTTTTLNGFGIVYI